MNYHRTSLCIQTCYYFAPLHLAEEIEFCLELPNHQDKPKHPFQVFDITDKGEGTDLLIVA